jgi:hypothetical protein
VKRCHHDDVSGRADHGVPTAAGLVQNPFISDPDFPQVAESQCSCGGSNQRGTVERNSLWKEELLEPLPLFE